MSKFKDGELVKWSSQAAGCSKEKTGKIAQVVAAGQLPDRDRFLHLYKSSGVGIARNHESYVVIGPESLTSSRSHRRILGQRTETQNVKIVARSSILTLIWTLCALIVEATSRELSEATALIT
jgi:hypothetical protein